MVERPRARRTANFEEPRSQGVNLLRVEFVKVSAVVDQNCALQRFFGKRVVADTIVREVVEDFEGEEIAGGQDEGVPVEYGAVDDLDVVDVVPGGGSAGEVASLEGSQCAGNFDDFEFGPGVDIRVEIADVVEDVEHERAVPCT